MLSKVIHHTKRIHHHLHTFVKAHVASVAIVGVFSAAALWISVSNDWTLAAMISNWAQSPAVWSNFTLSADVIAPNLVKHEVAPIKAAPVAKKKTKSLVKSAVKPNVILPALKWDTIDSNTPIEWLSGNTSCTLASPCSMPNPTTTGTVPNPMFTWALNYTGWGTSYGADTKPMDNGVVVPAISMWYGKVNQHYNTTTSSWETDPDGVAWAWTYAQSWDEWRADRKVEYCKRFYPNTTSVKQINDVTIHGWRDRGNGDAYTATMPAWECVVGNNTPITTGNTTTWVVIVKTWSALDCDSNWKYINYQGYTERISWLQYKLAITETNTIVGNEVVWTISYKNVGDTPACSIQINDIFPNTTQITQSSPAYVGFQNYRGFLTYNWTPWTVIPAGAVGTIRVTTPIPQQPTTSVVVFWDDAMMYGYWNNILSSTGTSTYNWPFMSGVVSPSTWMVTTWSIYWYGYGFQPNYGYGYGYGYMGKSMKNYGQPYFYLLKPWMTISESVYHRFQDMYTTIRPTVQEFESLFSKTSLRVMKNEIIRALNKVIIKVRVAGKDASAYVAKKAAIMADYTKAIMKKTKAETPAADSTTTQSKTIK